MISNTSEKNQHQHNIRVSSTTAWNNKKQISIDAANGFVGFGPNVC